MNKVAFAKKKSLSNDKGEFLLFIRVTRGVALFSAAKNTSHNHISTSNEHFEFTHYLFLVIIARIA